SAGCRSRSCGSSARTARATIQAGGAAPRRPSPRTCWMAGPWRSTAMAGRCAASRTSTTRSTPSYARSTRRWPRARSSTSAPARHPCGGRGRLLIHFVIPARDEAPNVPRLMADLAPHACRLGGRVIVVDDGSTDGTADELERHRGGVDLVILRHPRNLGVGAALETGLRAALAAAAD